MRQDTSFTHHYSFEHVEESSGRSGATYYYPGARTDGGRDGVLVRCQSPGHASWTGCFAFGDGGVRGLFTHPDERCLCVVSDGAGYIVRVDDPTSWTFIEGDSVMHVLPVPTRNLLVVADNGSVVAYGRTGVAWRTQLPADGLEFAALTDDQISFWAENPLCTETFLLTLDLQTGDCDTSHVMQGYQIVASAGPSDARPWVVRIVGAWLRRCLARLYRRDS